MKQSLLVVFTTLLPFVLFAQKSIKLSSPDGQILYSFQLKNKTPFYAVSYKKKPIIADSELGLDFLENGKLKNLRMLKPIFKEGVEEYELPLGRTKQVKDPFKELIVPLEEATAPLRRINLVIRAFNDGIAFRYEFPEQKNWASYSLTDENSTFRFIHNPKLLALFLPNFTSSHEGEYSSLLLSEVKEDTLMDMPALFEFPDKTFVAITEAALLNYAGMYLIKHNGVLTSRLSPLPGQTLNDPSGAGATKVKATLPHKTPWRVIMISDRVGSFLESNMLTSLNEPSKIKDPSWIKPGKTTFPWWNGSIIPDTTFAPGNNFENNQYYIDFCARNGIEYHSVVESCGHEWYTNDGLGYQPGPNADVTKPVPGIDMKQICDYAKSKGVGVRVWVHWKALYPKLDTAFAVFEQWGLSGMMVDFMDRDDQEMINIKEEILIKAAKHKLHIQFHGVEKPTGLSRTYPNEITREGTLNYEVNKWDKRITPDHDLNIVFARMIAGPSDYHMGGFRAVPDSLFKVQYTRPLMMGTRCHMLAMYVVLESYLGMVCDYPAAYEGQPGFDFVRTVPTVWDETKVLNASVGEYITIARRKGNDWFIGAITGSKARDITAQLNFLDEGQYEAIIYTDAGEQSGNPNDLNRQTRSVKKGDTISLHLASGGGSALHVRKKQL
jgi:alpha-glucosidase